MYEYPQVQRCERAFHTFTCLWNTKKRLLAQAAFPENEGRKKLEKKLSQIIVWKLNEVEKEWNSTRFFLSSYSFVSFPDLSRFLALEWKIWLAYNCSSICTKTERKEDSFPSPFFLLLPNSSLLFPSFWDFRRKTRKKPFSNKYRLSPRFFLHWFFEKMKHKKKRILLPL